ncbi:MAG: hypothetical protein JO256_05400 [Alphaproteobacteria bacterium]|nr:hypothetical protein [Alphaproteobacteria bacterium]
MKPETGQGRTDWTRQVARNRRQVGIEALLHYAYAEQLVHEARDMPVEIAVGGGPLAAYSPLWNEGVPVEGSGRRGFDASDDARAVHAQVLRLARVTVDCGHDLAAARYHAIPRGSRSIEPPTGRAADADHCGDPWPTNGILVLDLRSLVMIHALKRSRPERHAAADFRLKPGPVVWHPKRKSHHYARGWYCHVVADGVLPGEALEAHMRYAAWFAALALLRDALAAARLTMFSVTAAMPLPPKYPGRLLTGEKIWRMVCSP